MKLYLCESSFRPPENDSFELTNLSSDNTTATMTISECYNPEYVVLTWILCLVALTSIVKLYYLIKSGLATVIVAMFLGLLLYEYDDQVVDSNNG